MIKDFKSNSVYPVPTSYDKDEEVDLHQIKQYIDFLSDSGAKILMTTAGTSQFNLLNISEVRKINDCLVKNFKGISIVGIPALSLRDLKKEVRYYGDKYSMDKKVILLLLYPERYYGDDVIVDYFKEIDKISRFPIMLHGMIMRNGTGGMKEYDAALLNNIVQATNNIIGLKEECTSFESAYDLIRNIPGDFISIVAGKSIRRFEFLKKAGATTFLSGVGSFCPAFETKYFSSSRKVNFLRQEDKFFDTFMRIGWHKSMRAALKGMGIGCAYNRTPFPSSTPMQDREIKSLIEEIRKWTERAQ